MSARLLDIIIPTYNRPAKLYFFLESALCLGMKDVYFCVLDDGSTQTEAIDGVGNFTTQQVCDYFNHPAIIYIRNKKNLGLAETWVHYYRHHCQSKYVLSVVDKDYLIDGQPILRALQKLEHQPTVNMVVMPIKQTDRFHINRLATFNYERMSGKEFISRFINDEVLQQCTNYSVMRVSAIRKAGIPRSLNLSHYGLSDAFGIDIDFVFRIAALGDVDFEHEPHLMKIMMNGATESYPLTFAYCYYQYVKEVIVFLQQQSLLSKADGKKYIRFWLLLILRGLVVSYRPVHGTELECGTQRIKPHLKKPIHWYLLSEVLKHRVRPSLEMMSLFKLSLRILIQPNIQHIKASLGIKACVQKLQAKLMQYAVYLTGRTALDKAPTIAIEKGLEEASHFLKKTYRIFRPAAARFWIYLYDYLLKLETNELSLPENPNRLIVHFCCWGEDYVAKAKDYLLPSLNTPSNLPFINKTNQITLIIHGDQYAHNELMSSAVIQDMQHQGIQVKFFVVPKQLLNACNASCNYPNVGYLKRINRVHSNNKYYLLGGLQNHALKMAIQNKALISFMMPDFLLSEAFIQQAFSKIQNKLMVGITTFRTRFSEVNQLLKPFYHDKNKSVLTVSAKTLTDLQVKHIHPAARRRIVSESTENFVATPQLLFEHQKGIVIRAFHYHPVLLDCRTLDNGFKQDYMPIDYLILNQIIKNNVPYNEQLWINDDASVMAVMELSNEEVEKYYDAKKIVSAPHLIQQILNTMKASPHAYNMPLNRYFFSIRHKVFSDEVEQSHLTIEDQTFVSELLKVET